jgi:hypothetical protein
MRYSRGTASLLSTVFTIQARSVAAVDIFDQTRNDAGVNVDAGVLTPLDSGGAKGTNNDVALSSFTTASTCDADRIVTCANGFDVNSPYGATTCFVSCGDLCCAISDSNACEGFTGKVCKDGSCSGAAACRNAHIPLVVNSCKGYHACARMGDGGSIGNLNDSCNGERACELAGVDEGSIGNVNDSCIGVRACYRLGYHRGQVGNIINSCGAKACESAASGGGTIGSITNSCDGYYSCLLLGHIYGDVGNLLNSCKGSNACDSAAGLGGSIDGITGSCTDSFACIFLGGGNGKVGFVTGSCHGANSCRRAGSERGSIGSISQSCKAENACQLAGNGQTGAITSNLKSCCNTLSSPGVCESATELKIPAQCTHRSKVRQ